MRFTLPEKYVAGVSFLERNNEKYTLPTYPPSEKIGFRDDSTNGDTKKSNKTKLKSSCKPYRLFKN